MERFRIDFSLQRGHEMIIDRERGIRREQLDEIELQMLQGQRPPQLLPVEWFEMDGAVTFRYGIGGRKMLSHRLAMQQMTMQQFYMLLLAVVEALDECRHYMLRPEGCLLADRFIFVGERLSDVQLAYLPLKASGEGETGEYGDLLSLIVGWSARISWIDGSGFQRVLQQLHERSWPLRELRETLLALLGDLVAEDWPKEEEPGRKGQGAVAPSDAAPRLETAWSGGLQAPGMKKPPGPRRSDAPPGYRSGERNPFEPPGLLEEGGTGAASFRMEELEEDMEGAELFEARRDLHGHVSPASLPSRSDANGSPAENAEGRRKWMISAAIAIALAVVWRFLYAASPSSSGLLLSSGLTAMAAGGLLFVWFKKPKGSEPDEDWSFGREEEFAPESRLLVRKKKQPGVGESKEGPSVHLERETVPDDEEPVWRQRFGDETARGGGEAELYAYEPDDRTPLSLNPAASHHSSGFGAAAAAVAGSDAAMTGIAYREPASEATVLLGEQAESVLPSQGGIVLYREWQGSEQRLNWNGDRFTIGRAQDQVSYTDSAHGVSRLHLEIEAREESFEVKDLGSRNGSLLNGQTMIPYKSYALSAGDTVQLAGADGPKYAFRRE